MNSYAALSQIYDRWQEANDASKWADYTEKILARHFRRSKGDGAGDTFLLLDLGCGTGSFAIEMGNRGYDVLGLDQSVDMLAAAKAKDAPPNVRFVQQDITKMELFGTVDIIVCFLDTVNHILQQSKLDRLFKRCKNYLNPDGLFLFDLATPFYFHQVLGNQMFFDIKEEYAMFWQNSINMKIDRSQSELTFFIKQEDQSFQRGEEFIEEKVYPLETIRTLLQDNHLVIRKEYADLTFQKPTAGTRRVFFVVENTKDEWKRELETVPFEDRGKQKIHGKKR